MYSIKLLALSLSLMLSTFAFASGSAKISLGNNETMQLDWLSNGAIRMSTQADNASYLIVRDNQTYAVSHEGGEVRVFDLSSMFKMLGSVAKDMSPINLEQELDANWDINNYENTGKTETIAGIKGEVYQVKFNNKNNKTETETLVLTNNPIVVEMTQTYFNIFKAMTSLEKNSSLNQLFPGDKKGLLRVGNHFKVMNISNTAPSEKRFELPAKPQSFADMMQEMQKLMMQLGQ